MRSALEAAGLIRRVDGISDRARQAVVSPIKEMALLAEAVDGAVSLGWGLPSFRTPEHIQNAVRDLFIDDEVGKYPHPRGLRELRKAISEKFLRKSKVEIDPISEVLVTVGAQQAVASTLQTIINPGDEVILFTPCFSSHIDQVLLAGGIPKYVYLVEDEHWKLPTEEVERAITKRTKAIILNYPSNPTGTIFSESQLREIGDMAISHNFFVVTDETYNFLVYDDEPLFSMFSIAPLRKNLISCYSFSKEYAMTGWRVGYLCAEAGLIQEILKIHDATVVTAPRISQMAALAALRGPQNCVDEFRIELLNRRNLACRLLDRLGRLFSYSKPDGAYYLFPKINLTGIDSFAFALRLLNEARVVTTPGDAFGPAGEGHLRLCFAVQQDDIIESFKRIELFAEANLLL
jgi:aminotransferase